MALRAAELGNALWGAANSLRGQIDSADYKGYILGMLFLKRLSDHFEEETEAAMRAGLKRPEAERDRDEHEFFLPPEARWDYLQALPKGESLGAALDRAAEEIEYQNDALRGIFSGTRWTDESKLGSPANREAILRSLMKNFTALDLRDDNLRDPGERGGLRIKNPLGDAYEYLIEQFADDAGKKGGEFYTPRAVVQLVVELVQPQAGMRICDPTCGSGGMLIWAAEYVQQHGGDPKDLTLHGQERNLGTLGIGKLNMLLHNLRSADLRGGDTIKEPQFTDTRGRLLSYDRVLANPPFSLKEWGHDFAAKDTHHRFDHYGAIPPKTKGDMAFLQHMLAVTNPTGMVGVVLPHGVLFRGGTEATIRRSMIERYDLFEAVIGLAPNLFNGASIPVAVCVLNRAKPPERAGKVLFVDAAQPGHFRPGKARNYLDPEHVRGIVETYQAFADVPRFAHVADLAEIRANDFNLNISRYVDTGVQEERLDIDAALARLRDLEQQRDVAVRRMNELLMELGYGR